MRRLAAAFMAVALSVALALSSGCAAGVQATGTDGSGVATERADGWHRVVLEDMSFEVPDEYELDEGRTERDDWSHTYQLVGDETGSIISVSIFHEESDVVGEYEISYVDGTKVYWEDGLCTARFDHGGRNHWIGVMRLDGESRQKEILAHVLETLELD